MKYRAWTPSKLCIPRNYEHLTEYVKLGDHYGAHLHYVKLRDRKAAEKFVAEFSAASDNIEAVYVDVFNSLLSGDPCFVDVRGWTKIVEQHDITPDKDVSMEYGNERNKLYFPSLPAPDRFLEFKSTTILGANIDQSMIYRGWSDQGIEFVPHPKITKRLRYMTYTQGTRCDVRYLQQEADSKYYHKKVVNGRTLISQYDEEAKKFFAGKQWLYVANNDQPDLEEAPGAKRMPVVANGRNDFDDYDNIYFSAALNRRPKHLEMLYTLGFDPTYVTRASMHETIHQAVMRTSLRRPKSTSRVVGLVIDKPSGEAIARLFPGSTLGPLHGKARRVKPIPLSDTECHRNSRVSSLVAAKGLQKYYSHAVGSDDDNDMTENFQDSLII
jgi:hypothetical protein